MNGSLILTIGKVCPGEEVRVFGEYSRPDDLLAIWMEPDLTLKLTALGQALIADLA